MASNLKELKVVNSFVENTKKNGRIVYGLKHISKNVAKETFRMLHIVTRQHLYGDNVSMLISVCTYMIKVLIYCMQHGMTCSLP